MHVLCSVVLEDLKQSDKQTQTDRVERCSVDFRVFIVYKQGRTQKFVKEERRENEF